MEIYINVISFTKKTSQGEMYTETQHNQKVFFYNKDLIKQ